MIINQSPSNLPLNVSRIEAEIENTQLLISRKIRRKKKEKGKGKGKEEAEIALKFPAKSMRRVTETTPSGKLQGDLFRGGSRS